MIDPASIPGTMRAVHQPDRESHRLILTTTPLPVPSHPSDILIKVEATSLCLGELDWAASFDTLFPPDKEPVPGQDVAGTVISAPPDADFEPGDDVFGRIDATRPGGLREFALVRKEEVARKPDRLGWVEAAAVPLSALTAWEALFVRGNLDKAGVVVDAAISPQTRAEARARNAEKTVLVTAAGGSVGGWAVQFAALAGARAVVGVCSGAKADRVRQQGATDIIDYTTTSVEAWAASGGSGAEHQADLVLDCIGGPTMGGLWSAVKEGGVFLSICGEPEAVRPEGNTKTPSKAAFFIVESLGTRLAELAGLIDHGKVAPLIDSVYHFEQFAEAFERVEGRKASGKVVIKVCE